MADQTTTDPKVDLGGEDDSTFHTSAADANLAVQHGMGIGAAELAAQRDPGHAPAADEPDEIEDDEAEGDSEPDSNRRA